MLRVETSQMFFLRRRLWICVQEIELSAILQTKTAAIIQCVRPRTMAPSDTIYLIVAQIHVHLSSRPRVRIAKRRSRLSITTQNDLVH